MSRTPNRRQFLRLGGAAAALAVAGCQDDGGGSSGTEATPADGSASMGGGDDSSGSTATNEQGTLESVSVDEEWHRPRFDLANTGYSTNTGPTGEVEVRWHRSMANGVEGAPALVDGKLFVGEYGNGSLYALDAATGETVWKNQLDRQTHVGPTVADGSVYFTVENTVRALDINTGERQWLYDENLSIETTPLIVDGTVYVAEGPEVLHAIDAETGEQQWSVQYAGNVINSLAYADSVIYLASHSHLHAVDVTGPEFLWTTKVPNEVYYGPVYSDGTVLVETDKLYAFDAETGEQTWASDGIDTPAGIVAVRDGTVYTGDDDGEYALSLADGSEIWSQEVDDGERHVVTDDTLYVSTGVGLAGLDPATGEKRWSVESPGFPETHAVVASGLAFVGDSKGLTAFQEA